jgi:hypothetical protein
VQLSLIQSSLTQTHSVITDPIITDLADAVSANAATSEIVVTDLVITMGLSLSTQSGRSNRSSHSTAIYTRFTPNLHLIYICVVIIYVQPAVTGQSPVA